jgi:hypothetical protein
VQAPRGPSVRRVAVPARVWPAGAAVALDFKAAHFKPLNAAIFNSALGAAKGVAPGALGCVTLRHPAQKRQHWRENFRIAFLNFSNNPGYSPGVTVIPRRRHFQNQLAVKYEGPCVRRRRRPRVRMLSGLGYP